MLAAAPQNEAAGDPLRGFVEQAWDVPKQGIKFSPGVHVGACHFDFFTIPFYGSLGIGERRRRLFPSTAPPAELPLQVAAGTIKSSPRQSHSG
jgi:hypothetical protein